MRLEKAAFILMALMLVAALAYPKHAGLTISQFRHLLPGQEYSIWNHQTFLGKRFAKSCEQLQKEHPKDFQIQLGLACRLEGVEKSRALARLMKEHPEEPVVCAAAVEHLLDYGRFCKERFNSKDIPLNQYIYDDEQPKDVRPLFYIAERGIAIEPDNAYFHLVQAIALLGMHEDAEAQIALRNAANSAYYDQHLIEIQRAQNHMVDMRGGLNPHYRTEENNRTALSDKTNRADAARIIGFIAEKKITDGEFDTGIRLAMDLCSLGHMMAKDSDDFNNCRMGTACFYAGITVLDPDRSMKDTARTGDKKAGLGRACHFLTSSGYRNEASSISDHATELDKLRSAMKNAKDFTAPVVRFYYAFLIQIQILASLVLLIVVWAICALVTRRTRISDHWDNRALLVSVLLVMFQIVFFAGMLVAALQGRIPTDVKQPVQLIPDIVLASINIVAIIILACEYKKSRRSAKEAGVIRPISSFALVYFSLAFAFEMAVASYEAALEGQWISPSPVFSSAVIGLLAVYALFRMLWQWRTAGRNYLGSRFTTTLRAGSAVAVLMMSLLYILLIPLSTTTAQHADKSVRTYIDYQAETINQALKKPGN